MGGYTGTPMKTRSGVALLILGVLLPLPTAGGFELSRGYRLLRASDPKSMQNPPGALASAPQTCEPDVPVAGATAPDVLGDAFDPAQFDELSVTRAGRLVAYASSVTEEGIPGTTKQIVLLPEGPGETSSRIEAVGGGDNDQPTVQFDAFGYRVVFRALTTSDDQGASTIQLHSLTHASPEDETATVAVTPTDAKFGTGVRSFDPTFTARVRVHEFASDVKRRERDAFVAFVSTGDFTLRENPEHVEQLFLWEEQGRFFQITHNTDPDAKINRPSISRAGTTVVFESTGDLDPESVDPLDSSRVGNRQGVRQLFRWRLGHRVEQITWGDADSFSPRIDGSGRFVLFASRADFFDGANADHNLEIFSWTASARTRLRQLTQTGAGNNAFPRPTTSPAVFVFYSTVHPPEDGPVPVALFGKDPADPTQELTPECAPQAMLFDHGRVVHVHGFLDATNAGRLGNNLSPVLTGPPAVSNNAFNVFFATNDWNLNPRDDQGVRSKQSSLLAFYVGLASRWRR